jgi:hypothetical protein
LGLDILEDVAAVALWDEFYLKVISTCKKRRNAGNALRASAGIEF